MRRALPFGALALFVTLYSHDALAQTRCADQIYSLLRTPIHSMEDAARVAKRMEKLVPDWTYAYGFEIYWLTAERARARAATLDETIDNLALIEPVIATTPRSRKALEDFEKRLRDEAATARRVADENARKLDEHVRQICDEEPAPQPAPRPQSPPPPPPRPRPRRGTFTIVDAKVSNSHQGELEIDADGHSAHFDNRGHGGATWQVDYRWEVPDTIVAGEKASITIGEEITGVQPRQSISDAIKAFAPDFGKQLIARYPDERKVSETYEVPISEGYRDMNEIKITIEMVSSSVTYTYRKN